jgi:PIN domain nuclease of toxin-antitoxin system
MAEDYHFDIACRNANSMRELDRRFFILPIYGVLAVSAARIPTPFHGDPMDRLIVATALESGRTLITADRAILSSKACKLLW